VAALIGPAAHIASGPVVEAKQVQPLQAATSMRRLMTSFHILSLAQTLSDMRLYTPHLIDSSLLQDCLGRTLSEMKSLQTEFREKWGQ
jgi:hypothetical protein